MVDRFCNLLFIEADTAGCISLRVKIDQEGFSSFKCQAATKGNRSTRFPHTAFLIANRDNFSHVDRYYCKLKQVSIKFARFHVETKQIVGSGESSRAATCNNLLSSVPKARNQSYPILRLSFSRYTARTEISQGVIPAILEACPNETGCTLSNFSCASRRMPFTSL